MIDKFTFHKNIYLSESIDTKKLDKLKKRLQKKRFLANVYLIVPAHNSSDQLDIFAARQLAQRHYSKCAFLVLGIASNYEEALGLVEKMVQDCLKERGDCQLREYLLC